MDIINYKGYEAKIKYDEEDCLYYGELINIKDIVSFHSNEINDIEKQFHKAVNNYLEFCKEIGKTEI
jgi:predicted HicB family RNase H-like nuclease